VLVDLVELVRATDARPTLVGLTGPVSVGKTTIAGRLAEELAPLKVAIVSTDGFLYPNDELNARGIAMRKGFPESFDAARLNKFLADARAGVTPLRVPVYDHLIYDIRAGEEAVVDVGDVLIVEGVNALVPEHVEAYDVTVYVDAPDDAVSEWFSARLAEVIRGAVDEPGSFYAPLTGWSDEQIHQFAETAWHGINAVNLEEHIRPARERAAVVIEKNADHSTRKVRIVRP
jgi:type I pantothenate kinase